MTKKEFLNQLEKELQDLNKEEITSALKYYEDYFEDAGEENEQDVIKKLGTPREVAEVIKKDNIKNNDVNTNIVKKEPLPIWLIILIAVLFFPVILPIILAILGTVFGIFMGLIGIFIGLVCAGFGILVSGIASIIYGIITAFASSTSGLLILGVGFVLFGVGSILSLMSIKICTVVIPHIIRGLVAVCKFPFRNRGAII